VNLSVKADNLFKIDEQNILHSQFDCQKYRNILEKENLLHVIYIRFSQENFKING